MTSGYRSGFPDNIYFHQLLFWGRNKANLSFGQLGSSSHNDHTKFSVNLAEHPGIKRHVGEVCPTVYALKICVSIQVTENKIYLYWLPNSNVMIIRYITWYRVVLGASTIQQTQRVCSQSVAHLVAIHQRRLSK